MRAFPRRGEPRAVVWVFMGHLHLVDDQISQAFAGEPIPLAPASGEAAPGRRAHGPIQPAPPAPEPHRTHPLTRVLVVLVILAAAVLAGIAGWEIRRALWQRVDALRDERQLVHGFERGLAVVREAKLVTTGDAMTPGAVRWIDLPLGYRAYYDQIRLGDEQQASRLHDPPLRVAILAAWVNWLRERDPAAEVYVTRYARSLLVIGVVIEGVTALLAMAVVATIARRGGRWRRVARPRSARPAGAPLDGERVGAGAWILGLSAGVLVWLNPTILLNGHLAPAFDAWVVPVVLLVVLLVAWEAWLAAGAVMLLACLMQGQAIFVAPVLFLWPMFQGRISAGVRALTGFAAMAALLASPWLVPSQRAWAWIGVMVAFAAVLAPWLYPRRLGFAWWLATAFTLCVLIGSVAFDSSWPAVRMIEYVAQTRPAEMIRGPASNLPALLAMRYDWSPSDVIGVINIRPLSLFSVVTMEGVLYLMFGAVLLACAIGAAIQARRDDPQLLAAIITPWIAMFALLPGMHERWLIWAAVISVIGIAASAGLALIHLLLTALAAAMILHRLLLASPDYMPNVLRVLNGMHPDIAWALLLCLAVMVAVSLLPRRWRIRADAV